MPTFDWEEPVLRPCGSISDRLMARSLKIASLLCLFAAVPPVLATIGWIFEIPLLIKVHYALPAMQPNTVFGLVLSALAVWLTARGAKRSKHNLIVCAMAAVVSLLGWLTVGEYLFGWDLGIDGMLLVGPIQTAQLYPGRPSPQTSGNFAVFGGALLVYNLPLLPIRTGQIGAILVAANAVTAMTGYIFSASQFQGFPSFKSDLGMAIHTAVSFVLLSAALLLSRPDKGMMSLVVSDTRSSIRARRVMLTAILAPPAVGALTKLGVLARWYDVSAQISLFVLVIGGLLLRTTWQASRQAEKDELEQRKTQDRILRSQERYELALRGADLGAWDWNIPTGEVIFNTRWAEMRGFALDEIRPHVDSWTSGVHPDDLPGVQRALKDHLQGLTSEYEAEFRALTRDGRWIWILDRGRLFERDENGQPIRMTGTELDITDRKRLEEELQFLEAKASGILSISADAIVSIDEQQRITLFNHGAEKIFGYSHDEMIGAPLEILIPESHRARHAEHVNAFLAGAVSARQMGHRGGGITGLRKNGQEFPADAAISKLTVGGKTIMTVSLRDVTASRIAQQQIEASLHEKEVLLREVHHRVKNNLQTVSSLLHLQAQGIRDQKTAAVLRESESRIQAMALVHQALHQSANLAAIDFLQYLRELAVHVMRCFGADSKRIQVTFDNVASGLSLDAAVACGLVTQELLSNSLKHAFPNGRKGTIRIGFDRQEDGYFVLKVADDGIGIPTNLDLARLDSLGLRLVAALGKQLRGELKVERLSNGTGVSLRFRPKESENHDG